MNTMDKQKIGFIGALAIVLVAVVGGIYLAAKGVAVPAWLASLLAVIGPAFAWYAKPPGSGDGAAKAVGLLLVLALGSSVSACSWLRSGNHAKDVASILTCISGEAAAGKSPGEIALTCGLQSADEVIDLVTRSQGVAAAAPKMGKPPAAPSSSSSGSK